MQGFGRRHIKKVFLEKVGLELHPEGREGFWEAEEGAGQGKGVEVTMMIMRVTTSI